MKKIKISIYALLASGTYYAQTNSENYIQTRIYLEPVQQSNSNAKQIRTLKYFDDLGRLKQQVDVKASPGGKDIVTPFVYDEFERQTRNYLPIPQSSTNDGQVYSQNSGLVPYPVSDATNVYEGEKIYAEKKFENSVSETVIEQNMVGNSWSNKPIKFNYELNDIGEVRNYVGTFNYNTFQAGITLTGNYPAGQLYKNKTIDEDGNVTIEFKNSIGQILLIRKIVSASENADTYYVYNNYNQLAFVIPPLAAVPQTINDNILNNLCYLYRYDEKNRLVEKKIPGKGWEFMVYDKQDRLVLKQDAVLGSTTNNFTKKGWLFNKYDQFGRVVYTGFFANSSTRTVLQTAINNMVANSANNESRSLMPFTQNGLDIYYSKTAFPTGSMTVLSVNYYDTYPSLPAEIVVPNYIINTGQTVLKDIPGEKNTKDFLVASYVKNIEDDNWTKYFIWYDLNGRNIGTYSINHLGGQTRTESLLDYAGVIKESRTYHKRTANDIETKITETFQYDHQNRLISRNHKVNSETEEPLSIYSYNEQGQIVNKKIGLDESGNPLQSIDYGYNIRGWITSINDPSNLGDKIFGMKIKYQNPEDINYGIAKYNGTISEIDWKTTLGDGIYRRYDFKYDHLDRMTDGIYLTPYLTANNQNHFYDESISYDINGNIKSLDRYKNPPVGQNIPLKIDELIYEYEFSENSNKLIKVTDQKMNSSGYPIGGNIIGYDNNGNMTSNLDKNIKNIKYNFLNLPTTVDAVIVGLSPSANEGKLHLYKYRADGVKYSKKVNDINPYSQQFSENEYLDGFNYERQYSKINTAQNSFDSGYKLKFIPTSEGFYNFEKNEYVYNLTDHLGNTRYSFTKAKGGGKYLIEETNYYPFGLKHEGYNDNGSLLNNYGVNYNYKYNGKELQETGMYDYGARSYMPDLGRWGVIDPVAEYDATLTPYRYAYNNPLKFIDPNGMFETRFGAWLHKITHGGGSDVRRDNDKKYYYDVRTKNEIESDGGIKMTAHREYGKNSSLSIKSSANYEAKGTVEFGIIKMKDKGTSGYELKGPTIFLGELIVGQKGGEKYMKAYNPIYEFASGRSIRGNLAGVKLETSQGDFKANAKWELKSLYWLHMNPQDYVANIQDHIEVTKEVGVGKPWFEFKVQWKGNKIIFNYGLQEDWGQSYYNSIGIKGDFRYQGVTEISY